MARAQPKPNHQVTDIADLIIAEWYRVVRAWEGGQTNVTMDEYALTAGLNEILDEECQAVLDVAGEPIKIVIPLPPGSTSADIDDYLQRNSDFRTGMSMATLFGCGR